MNIVVTQKLRFCERVADTLHRYKFGCTVINLHIFPQHHNYRHTNKTDEDDNVVKTYKN